MRDVKRKMVFLKKTEGTVPKTVDGSKTVTRQWDGSSREGEDRWDSSSVFFKTDEPSPSLL